jgi:hypothetical protein
MTYGYLELELEVDEWGKLILFARAKQERAKKR